MSRIITVLLTVSLSFPVAAGELTKERYLELHAELQPDPDALWRSIPWETSVLEAQRIAAETKKPLFIWAMDGHPLGCT